MADEIANPTPASVASTAQTAEAATSPDPVATESPAQEPAAVPAEIMPATEPVKTDDAAPTSPPPEAPAEETKPEEAKKPETLLASEKKIEEKPADSKTETKTEEKPVEVKSPDAPAYDPFTLPENVEMDAEKMGEFTKTLGEFEVNSKASHEEVQKLGQQLIDRHLSELNRYTESLTNAWNKQKSDWKDSFVKDPEFSNRIDTVVNSAIDAISVYAGDTKQQNEFRELMESTGIGNHPAMIRLLSNVMIAKAEPRPLAAPQIASSAKLSKTEKMYGKKTG